MEPRWARALRIVLFTLGNVAAGVSAANGHLEPASVGVIVSALSAVDAAISGFLKEPGPR